MIQKFLIIITLLFTTILVASLVSSKPLERIDRNINNEIEFNQENFAAALQFLQELERRHGFDAKPRFGKRSDLDFNSDVREGRVKSRYEMPVPIMFEK